jgi:uncharacterized membrane protein YecN with MAPEG domain
MTPLAAPLYAGLLALGYLALSVRVMRARGRAGVPLGTGGDAGLERAIRVHGNFAEYVPMALLLLLIVELLGTASWLLHACGLLLLAGRVLHALGIGRETGDFRLRAAGVGLTFTPIAILALTAIARSFT